MRMLRRVLTRSLVVGLCLWPATASAALEYRGAQMHPRYPDRTAAANARELDALEAVGATTVRMDLSWTTLEPVGRGRYDQGYLRDVDDFIGAARARGIKPILNLHSTPCWASSAPGSVKRGCRSRYGDVNWYPPTSNADLAGVASFLAGRYAADLAALEVWNEPNHPNFMKPEDLTSEQRADRYAAMLDAVYPAVKRAAPTLTVVGGAIEGTDVPFLEALYERGAGDDFDALSFHPYHGPRSPYRPRPSGWDPKYDFRDGTAAMRDAMVAHGDAAKQVWLTELGWTTCADGSYICVSERDQATFVKEALTLIRTRWPWVRAATFYEARDSRDGSCTECRYGLLRRDFSPKPAYRALRSALRPFRPRLVEARVLGADWWSRPAEVRLAGYRASTSSE